MPTELSGLAQALREAYWGDTEHPSDEAVESWEDVANWVRADQHWRSTAPVPPTNDIAKRAARLVGELGALVGASMDCDGTEVGRELTKHEKRITDEIRDAIAEAERDQEAAERQALQAVQNYNQNARDLALAERENAELRELLNDD